MVPVTFNLRAPIPAGALLCPSQGELSVAVTLPVAMFKQVQVPGSSVFFLCQSVASFREQGSKVPCYDVPPVLLHSSGVIALWPTGTDLVTAMVPTNPRPVATAFFPFFSVFNASVLSEWRSRVGFSVLLG